AATDGMDMSMDNSMTLASDTMMTTLHFSLGDTLRFAGFAAVRAMMEAHWRAAARVGAKNAKGEEESKGKSMLLAYDVMRGVMHTLQAVLGFVFMWAVLTFQASLILALVLGLGLGEALVGRYAGAARIH
ncbi:CTR copper uptake transporter, partial [Mycena latifolia]